MAALFNLVAMTVSSAFGTSSTIPLSLAATLNGVTYLSFSSAGASGGTSIDYSILDTGNSEIGTATYTSSNTTLTSRTPTKSTNANAAINASSAAVILCTPRAEDVGTVSQIISGTGLTGGPITTTGTLAVSMNTIVTNLSSDTSVGLSNTFTTGPIISSAVLTGTWFVMGAACCKDTSAAVPFVGRLYDGTNVIANSGFTYTTLANGRTTCLPFGFTTNPSSFVRLQALDAGSSQGFMVANDSGAGHDSYMIALRIG